MMNWLIKLMPLILVDLLQNYDCKIKERILKVKYLVLLAYLIVRLLLLSE